MSYHFVLISNLILFFWLLFFFCFESFFLNWFFSQFHHSNLIDKGLSFLIFFNEVILSHGLEMLTYVGIDIFFRSFFTLIYFFFNLVLQHWVCYWASWFLCFFYGVILALLPRLSVWQVCRDWLRFFFIFF